MYNHARGVGFRERAGGNSNHQALLSKASLYCGGKPRKRRRRYTERQLKRRLERQLRRKGRQVSTDVGKVTLRANVSKERETRK
jgi:hypothetical protein